MEDLLLRQFKHFFSDLQGADLSTLDQLYARDALFKDPVHEVRGLVALQDYFTDLCGELQECRFEYLDELVSCSNTEMQAYRAYIKWMMHFRHPKLGGKLIGVRGVSHIQYGEKIHFHEDIYDLGQMLYEHVPVVGGLTRWLKRRLAG